MTCCPMCEDARKWEFLRRVAIHASVEVERFLERYHAAGHVWAST